MKTTYDAASDGLTVRFTDVAVHSSDEVKPGVALDLDGEGRLVGITLRGAKDVLARSIDPFGMAEAPSA